MSGFTTVLIAAEDLSASRKFYAELSGTEPIIDEDYYVAFQFGDIHLGLNTNGTPAAGGTVLYWPVADMQAALLAVEQHGGAPLEEPRQVGGGRTVATVTDPAGNIVGLQHDAQQ